MFTCGTYYTFFNMKYYTYKEETMCVPDWSEEDERVEAIADLLLSR